KASDVIRECLVSRGLGDVYKRELLYILYYSLRFEYLNVIIYNNLGITALYYGIILLFSYFIARRFNKRLFKFTAQHSLKSEVVKND
ncbi:MAG: hypothetical protein K2K50_03475, partial [Anaeroplasmataceae bacterium]|nr:hypothetical protein [Anaeroplasmataceae bacterium]